MKIYRSSFWSAATTTSNVIPMFIILIIISPVFTSIKEFLYFVLIISWLIPLFITQYFYVITTENELIIRNGILPFWKKIYNYNDITKVRLIYLGGFTHVYMQVKTKNKKGWWRYVIDLVKAKEYLLLIKDLEDKGVVVERKLNDKHIKNVGSRN